MSPVRRRRIALFERRERMDELMEANGKNHDQRQGREKTRLLEKLRNIQHQDPLGNSISTSKY